MRCQRQRSYITQQRHRQLAFHFVAPVVLVVLRLLFFQPLQSGGPPFPLYIGGHFLPFDFPLPLLPTLRLPLPTGHVGLWPVEEEPGPWQ